LNAEAGSALRDYRRRSLAALFDPSNQRTSDSEPPSPKSSRTSGPKL
jgi:hypothetical protein